MKGIPNTPTDNIYKFMAISGLWFITGFIVLYIWLINTQIELDKESQQLRAYFFSVNVERNIKNRLNSLNSNKLDDNRLDWVHESFSVEQEVDFLSKVLKKHQSTIKKYQSVQDSNMRNDLVLINRWDVRVGGILYIILMVGLTWFGFSRWVKTHYIDEELRSLDRKIKVKTLEKIELEIAEIKRRRQPTSLDNTQRIERGNWFFVCRDWLSRVRK